MNLSAGVALATRVLSAGFVMAKFLYRGRLRTKCIQTKLRLLHRPTRPDAACVSLSVEPVGQLRPASPATEDVPAAPPACEYCQSQVSPAFASTSVENFV